MRKLPLRVRELLAKKTIAHIATLMPDGSPHVSPVWIDVDGDIILVNSAVGRVKHDNIVRDRRVALSAVDPENPYRGVTLRGRVVELQYEPAQEHIDRLSQKYLDLDEYPYAQPNELRVIYRIAAEVFG